MKLKYFIIFILLIALYSISAIGAVSNNTLDNVVCEMDSNIGFISVSNDNLTCGIDESKSLVHSQDFNNEVLQSDDGFEDNNLDDDFEDPYDEYELSNEEINKYLEDIQSSTSNEYFNFVKYLLNTKKLVFNQESLVDGGYKIFAIENYEMTLYDGGTHKISMGDYYFISTSSDLDLFVEGFYPNTFHYDEYGDVVFDKLYYSWQDSQTKIYVDYDYAKETTLLPYEYDLRKYGYVTPVQDQSSGGNCWAFASIAALESYLLKNEGETYDFSENNLKNVMSSIGSIGTDKIVNNGGSILMSIPYFIRWSGPILEKDDVYLSNKVIENLKPVKHVQGIHYILNRSNSSDNNGIKQAIMDYGGVVTSIYWDNFFVRNDTSSYYNPMGTSHNHEICIVGWDDNYSKSNFKIQLEGMMDGAFIIKNSWGDTNGDDGYYYVSYSDPTLAIDNKNSFVSYVFTDVENNTNYGFNYYYTPLGFNDLIKVRENDVKFYNQWVSHKDDTLEACGFYNFIPSKCQINVFIDDEVKRTSVINIYDLGYHTIKFEPVDIEKGQKFKIEITLTALNSNFNYVALEKKFKEFSKVTANPGESFVYIDGEWKDMSEDNSSNICLNAYTRYFDLKETKIIANNIVMNYGENKFLDIILLDIDNNPLKNEEIILTIDNNEKKFNTDDNGKIRLSLKYFNASKVEINIKYWGDKIYDSSQKMVMVNIKKLPTTITINGFTYKDQYLKIFLKKGSYGISNKEILINIHGNQYTVKTNTKGCAILKTSKNLFTANSKVTVKFNGDANYNPSSSSSKIKQFILNLENFKSTYKTNEKVEIKLNKKVALKLKVTVKINSKYYNAFFKTNKNGKANIKLYSKFKNNKLKTKNKYVFEFNCCNKNYLLKKNSSIKISFKN